MSKEQNDGETSYKIDVTKEIDAILECAETISSTFLKQLVSEILVFIGYLDDI